MSEDKRLSSRQSTKQLALIISKININTSIFRVVSAMKRLCKRITMVKLPIDLNRHSERL